MLCYCKGGRISKTTVSLGDLHLFVFLFSLKLGVSFWCWVLMTGAKWKWSMSSTLWQFLYGIWFSLCVSFGPFGEYFLLFNNFPCWPDQCCVRYFNHMLSCWDRSSDLINCKFLKGKLGVSSLINMWDIWAKIVYAVWCYVSESLFCLILQNAFWFSLGWCLFFFVPCLIFAVKLAGLYRRETEKEYDDFDRP